MHQLDIRIDWQAFVAGDERILEHVYNTFFNSLFNFGRKYTTNEDLIADAIQDLFVRLWKNRRNLQKPKSLKNYLFKGFRNHLNDRLKSEARYVPDEFGDQCVFEWAPSAEDIQVSTEMVTARKNRLDEAMARLTDRQREAIFLRFYEEFSYVEVAEVLGITIKATYKLMARSIEVIRVGLDSNKATVLFILLHRITALKLQ